eukprot:scaffold80894_cov17-Tisochrysis_lutea.AAC.1
MARSSPQLEAQASHENGKVPPKEGWCASMAHSSPQLGGSVLREDPWTGILRLSSQGSQTFRKAYASNMSSISSSKQKYMHHSRSTQNALPKVRSCAALL